MRQLCDSAGLCSLKDAPQNTIMLNKQETEERRFERGVPIQKSLGSAEARHSFAILSKSIIY